MDEITITIIETPIIVEITVSDSEVNTGIMKYSQIITLIGGQSTVITTTLANKPYSILILDSSGKPITDQISIESMIFTGGVYVFTFGTSTTITNAELKILS